MGLGKGVPVSLKFVVASVLGWGLLLVASGGSGGCALVSRPPSPDPVLEAAPELPADFVESPAAGSYQPQEWWRAFADPVLDEVVESVLASNFSVAEAVARVQQARTRARLADAAILPVVGARAGVDTFDLPTNAAIGAQLDELGLDFPLPDRLGLTTYSLSADFAYELDFWGRARHAALAAGSELLASESDLRAARIGILAETIGAYFEIGHLRRQHAIARRQAEMVEERERLVANRYERGLAGSIDLHRARQALRSAEAGAPRIESQLAEAESGLAVLLGGYRQDVAAILPDSLSPAPAGDPVPAGIPADLLFSLEPDDVNLIEGGQRPRFVMSPTIVTRYDKPYFALGSAGGWTIPQTILQVLVRALDYEMDAPAAVTAPRFVVRYLANSIPYMDGTDLVLEKDFSDEVREALNAKGHRLREPPSRIGMLNAIKIYPGSGVLSGGPDKRREGHAAGW